MSHVELLGLAKEVGLVVGDERREPAESTSRSGEAEV